METIIEARRYLDNARKILRENAGKEDGFYQDARYVKMAGHTAYVGVVMALHLNIAYDGTLDAEVIQTTFKRAETIIDWVETKTAA